MALISCDSISLSLGGRTLLNQASLQIERGERIGLLGRNGEGKSSLLRLLAGELSPDEGTVSMASGFKLAILSQQVPVDPAGTVGRWISEGCSMVAENSHPVEKICSLLDLDPGQAAASLSGGQARRMLLGQALVGDPDLLLLDEPTNHLDIERILWLENYLSRFSGSLLFVTHDRAFLQRLATRIIELDRGQLTSWDCDYPTYLTRKETLWAAEEKQWVQFDKKLAQEEVWIRKGIKARRTRNEGRVRALEQLRKERSLRRERIGQANIQIQSSEKSGVKVIDADDVSFAYEGQPPLIDHFSVTLTRGDKVGIIGANGCGKTTLLKLLLGKWPPQCGQIRHGTMLEIAYFDQHRHTLDDERSVFDNIADGNDHVLINGKRRHVMSYLADFLFSADMAPQRVRRLSGGERNRLLLARLFTQPGNVLVLDEPTNDLDAETLELLESRLVEYEGTVLVVSHDRKFLDNLCTSSLVFEGNGRVREYAGGYSDWKNLSGSRTQKPTPLPASASKQNAAQRSSGRKLSNREREEWTTLPATIEQAETEWEALQQTLADPQFFRGDPETIRQATERAKTFPERIEALYTRWAELDERR